MCLPSLPCYFFLPSFPLSFPPSSEVLGTRPQAFFTCGKCVITSKPHPTPVHFYTPWLRHLVMKLPQQASWGKSSEPEKSGLCKTSPLQATTKGLCLHLEISPHTNKVEPLYPPGTEYHCASQAGFTGLPCCRWRLNSQRQLSLDNVLP